MSIATKIQWCDSTCNPTMGCEGCELWNPKTAERSCYAGVLHLRYGGVTKGYSPTFEELTYWPGRMAAAARWSDLTGTARKDKPWLDGLPRLIFVSDMSDALSAVVPFDFLEEEVIRVVTSPTGQRHRWLWLTKRPDRMAQFSDALNEKSIDWPKNLWAGTSITTQGTTSRIKHLLRVGADRTVRFLSVEPQRAEIDIREWLPRLDWVIQGGESGRGARPFHVEWALDLIRQCQQAGVAYFLKQLGSSVLFKGQRLWFRQGHAGDWSEWPAEVQVREMPHRLLTAAREELLPVLTEAGDAATNKQVPLEVVDGDSKGRQAALKAWRTRRDNERNGAGSAPRRPSRAWVSTMNTADTNPEYWDEYSNLQHVKHAVIREYLNGWFPKMTLGQWGCNRLLYIDTHAGRGKHLTGQLGSPLVALNTLLKHQSRDRILRKTEVQFFFIERDKQNVAALNKELAAVSLPKNVSIHPEHGDAFEVFNQLIADLDKEGSNLAPSFIFVDPYGFKLPGSLLRKLMGYSKVELFVNVIWRELDMAIQQARADSKPGMVTTLTSVFDGDGWRKISAADADARAEQCADLFREMTGARWGTHLRMLDNDRIRYFLLHLTKHDAGRDLMKECIWKACPDGGFYASKSDNPRQRLLIQPKPDLRPLHDWLKEKLSTGPKRWQTLADDLREELWLGKHLNDVIRLMRKNEEIVADGYTGPFAPKNNPLLHLGKRPEGFGLFGPGVGL
jgi:three-Cys-motif partner protein